jgi:hypothetical protein
MSELLASDKTGMKSEPKKTLEWNSASITAVCNHKGKRFILVGRESAGHDQKGNNWDTFGGGREVADKSPKDTAIREFDEETMGVFGSVEFIRKNLLPVHVRIKDTKHYIYLLELDYDPVIVETYNRMLKRMQGCFSKKNIKKGAGEVSLLYIPSCAVGLFEKTMIAWYPVDNILATSGMLRKHSEKALPVLFKKASRYMSPIKK